MMNNQTYTGEKDYFTVAALVCATLSIASLCLVVFSPFFGCLGILFAILAKRRCGRMTNESKIAIFFAGLGLAIGVILIIVMLPEALRLYSSGEYSAWMSQFNQTFGTVSGNSVSGPTP